MDTGKAVLGAGAIIGVALIWQAYMTNKSANCRTLWQALGSELLVGAGTPGAGYRITSAVEAIEDAIGVSLKSCRGQKVSR